MFKIRNAELSDLPSIIKIQNEYIQNGFNGMFYERPFELDERISWFNQFNKTGPYQILVAVVNNDILGVTSSFPYRGGGVFSKTVETSIYTAMDKKSSGVGSKLYKELFERLNKEDLHLAVVGIALPNEASINIHRKFDFKEIGIFKEYAYFNGKYISSMWMQKFLDN